MTRLFRSAIALTLVLLMTACGGGGDDDDESSAASSPTQTSQTTQTTETSNVSTGETATTTAATSDPPSGAASSVDACSLLTPEEIGEVYQTEIGAGEPQTALSRNATACMWPGLYMEVLTEGGMQWYETVNFGQNPELVEGIGDKASFGTAGTLDVVDGEAYISLQVIPGPFLQLDRREAAKSLAEIVLSRLP